MLVVGDFFLMMQLDYVTYDVYLRYSSHTEEILLYFSFIKTWFPTV